MVLLQRRFLRQPPWVANELWRRARAVPSLDLRFADTKSLTDAVSGQNLITFTRASSGTYVGSDGLIKTAAVNEPRFDHNPTTGESLGLLVEETRTNLLLRSEEFDNAYWSVNNSSVTANTAVSPDGLTTADLLTETSANGHHNVYRNVTVTNGTVYTLSCYAKPAGRNWLSLYEDSAINYAWFNLSTGVVGSVSGTGVTATIQALGDGWYRCALTYTQVGTIGRIRIALTNANGVFSYQGDGTSGIYIWGAQLEVGSFSTSYIPTSSATVTRSADVASITGANFTRWYRQDEGTMFCSATSPLTLGSQIVAQVVNGTTALERIVFTRVANSNNAGLTVNASGSVQASISAINAFIANAARLSTAYKQDDIAFVANGGSVGTDSSALLPTVDRLELGQFTSAAHLNGTLSRLTYWQSRLPNSTLQDLSR